MKSLVSSSRVPSSYFLSRRCSSATNAVNTQVNSRPLSRVQSLSTFCLQLYNNITGELQRQQVYDSFQITHSELRIALQQSAELHKLREDVLEATKKEKDEKMRMLKKAQMANEEIDRNSDATVDEKQAAFQNVVNCMMALDRVGTNTDSSRLCREADENLRQKFGEWKDAYSRKNDEDKRFNDRSRMMALVVGPLVTLLSFAGTAVFHYARQPARVQEQFTQAQMKMHEQWLSKLEHQNQQHEAVITTMLARHKAELEQLQQQLQSQKTVESEPSWRNWASVGAIGFVAGLIGKSFG